MQKKNILKRRGIVRSDRSREDDEIGSRRILDAKEFPEETFLYLDADKLPINEDLQVDKRASSDYSAFEAPPAYHQTGGGK